MAAFNTDVDAAAVAADHRLRARATTLRADWRKVQSICRNALTSPATIGGVAILGAVVGARPRSPVECRCTNAAPSFLRMLLLAIVTPVLKQAISRALTKGMAADVAPGPVPMSAEMVTPGFTAAPP